jgi:cell wall-associated NlpC family hydrolase
MNELLAQRAMLEELVGSLSIISADAGAVLDNLPADLSPERKAVIKAACTLVGKVNYFWGGKSYVIGWDSRWGQIQKVWADGSSTTGTYRPYGLDCSGFVDWVFYQISEGEYIIGHGGGATKQHEYCDAMAWSDAQPGDLVFYPEDSHVGIVGGRDEGGNLIIIHCASGYNNVVVTGIEGFTSIGRPTYYP